MNHISIELCKVSYKDNKPYIVIMASCPESYTFTGYQIKNHIFDGGVWHEACYDIPLVALESKNILTHLIPIESLSSAIGGIYTVTLMAYHNEDETQLTESAYISDVKFVYHCLLDKLMHSTQDCCSSVSDDVIRLYLTLYGHVTAMQYKDLITAKEMYARLLKCGCKCIPNVKSSCGCK